MGLFVEYNKEEQEANLKIINWSVTEWFPMLVYDESSPSLCATGSKENLFPQKQQQQQLSRLGHVPYLVERE